MKEMLVIFIFSISVFLQNSALALDCPKFPEQISKNLEVEVNAAVAKIGPVTGSELQTRTRNATQDLLGLLPDAEKVYLEQMMYAAYCSGLRDDPSLSETEKARRLREYNSEVRNTIAGHLSVRPPSKQEALSDLPRIDWGIAEEYFNITNPRLGKLESDLVEELIQQGQIEAMNIHDVIVASDKGEIAFDVTFKIKKSPREDDSLYSRCCFAIFFDSEGTEMGRSDVFLSPKYKQTGWVQGMPGKGFIPLTVKASDIKVIKIQGTH